MFNKTSFHELTHAAHAKKMGVSFWNDVVNNEVFNMIKGNGPYGYKKDNGNTSMALAKTWANNVSFYE